MLTAEDLTGAAIVGAASLALLAVAELWHRFGRAKPEWTRKLVHLGGGLLCLLFPWLVDSPWVVLALAGGMSGLFAWGAHSGFLPSLHKVGRRSRGCEYYPLAIWLAYLMGRDEPAIYVGAVLTLAAADTGAALVGTRYGRWRYEIEDETKSIQGSAAFLAIAFLAIALPLGLGSPLGWPLALAAAFYVALLATAFEAISRHGFDNLLVPFATCVAIQKVTAYPFDYVLWDIWRMLALAGALALLVWGTRVVNTGGAIAWWLYAYGAWALADIRWAAPVFFGFPLYLLARRWEHRDDSQAPLRLVTTSRALLVPFLCIAAANVSQRYDPLLGPYLAATVAVCTFGVWGALQRSCLTQKMASGAAIGLFCWLVCVLPTWALALATPWTAVVATALAVPLALATDTVARRRTGQPPAVAWTAGRFLVSLLAALLVLAAQHIAGLPVWAGE